LAALAALALAAAAGAHPAADERLAALDAELAVHPGRAALWLSRALATLDLGAAEHALADVARAERLGADAADVATARGLVALERGDAGAAVAAFDRALDLRPGVAQTLALRARAHRAAGAPEAAARDYAAARIAAGRPDPEWVAFEVEALRAAGRADSALAVLAAATDSLGPVPALVDAAVELELAAGRGEAALAWLDRGLAGGDRATGLARRAELLIALGRPDEATRDLSAAWQALASRPAHRRSTRAFVELSGRVRAMLVALGHADPLAVRCEPLAGLDLGGAR
jgi:tetratricopeptide (TPR) repeat protein